MLERAKKNARDLQRHPKSKEALRALTREVGQMDEGLAEVQALGLEFRKTVQGIEENYRYYREKTFRYIHLGGILIPLLLVVRFICVGIPVVILKHFRTFSPHVTKIMTWGGLRGGISVALALSLPTGPHREAILAITYMIVVFSIIVQGLTIGKLVKRGDKGLSAEDPY
jgi:NhaP-type Na+/H+ or K+/H+ antiporter